MENKEEKQYLKILQKLIDAGSKEDRTELAQIQSLELI